MELKAEILQCRDQFAQYYGTLVLFQPRVGIKTQDSKGHRRPNVAY